MLKKVISLFICFAAAFTLTVSSFAQSGGAEVEAASSIPLYLKYYYDQIGKDGQEFFLKMREAVINCEGKATFSKDMINNLTEDDIQKAVELLICHDPMAFNLSGVDYDPKHLTSLILKYNYKKETYQKMVDAYEKRVDKILGKLTDDMSTYKKIKTIHDSIVNTAVYDLNAKNNGNLYGTLVNKKARCVGYAFTFDYICSKAGIRTVSVMGDGNSENQAEKHMWNKVYYNKQWYNVDVTWDDPESNFKKNLSYDYFMISDKTMFRDHTEDNMSFKTPKASDDSKAYYKMNKKYAEDLKSAKSILKSSINSASKNGTTTVTIQCASSSVYQKFFEYLQGQDVYGVLSSAKKNYNKNLVDNVYNYSPNSDQYTVTIVLFYKNTSLDKYFVDTNKLSSDMREALKANGIK
ncbi:MAG: hypothetical protein J1F11_11280 [Oscillospiraceae bacterium]|nr:hypothetical protein [Oscillospiraceae bacterium]